MGKAADIVSTVIPQLIDNELNEATFDGRKAEIAAELKSALQKIGKERPLNKQFNSELDEVYKEYYDYGRQNGLNDTQAEYMGRWQRTRMQVYSMFTGMSPKYLSEQMRIGLSNKGKPIREFYERLVKMHSHLVEKTPSDWNGQTREDVKKEINFDEGKGYSEINSPIETVKIKDGNITHLIKENDTERKKKLLRTLRTIQNPNIIVEAPGHKDYNRDKTYHYYIKLFNVDGKTTSHWQIVKIAPDGNFYTTNFGSDKKQIDETIERGKIIYDLSSLPGNALNNGQVVYHNDGQVLPTSNIIQDKTEKNKSNSSKGLTQPESSQSGIDDNSARGSVTFENNSLNALVELFKGSDASTLPHELAHVFLMDMQRLAAINPDGRLAGMFEDLREAIGEPKGEIPGTYSREQQELFAKMWERYLAEEHAPTKAWQRVFSVFKEWLRGVYKTFKDFPELSPAAKSLFDKWLSFDDTKNIPTTEELKEYKEKTNALKEVAEAAKENRDTEADGITVQDVKAVLNVTRMARPEEPEAAKAYNETLAIVDSITENQAEAENILDRIEDMEYKGARQLDERDLELIDKAIADIQAIEDNPDIEIPGITDTQGQAEEQPGSETADRPEIQPVQKDFEEKRELPGTYIHKEEDGTYSLKGRYYAGSYYKSGRIKENRGWEDVEETGTIFEGFKTEEEARAFASRLAEMQEEIPGSGGAKAERAGLPRRPKNSQAGKGLLKMLGFKDVKTGRELTKGEEKALASAAYDGIYDLAEILNIPPESLALNGTLTIKLGAPKTDIKPGEGAKYRAKDKTIIMDSEAGSGRFAAAWYAAFTDYMQSPDIRPEMKAAFKELRKAINSRKLTAEEIQREQEKNLKEAEKGLKEANDAIDNSEVSFELYELVDEINSSNRYIEAYPIEEENLFDGKPQERQAGVDNRIIDEAYQAAGEQGARLISDLIAAHNNIIAVESMDFSTDLSRFAADYSAATGKTTADSKERAASETELEAAAFASYIYNRLLEKGGKNTFLARPDKGRTFDVRRVLREDAEISPDAEPGEAGDPFAYPYPVGRERKEIFKAFDKVFSTLKYETTEQGTRLYQEGKETAPYHYADVSGKNVKPVKIIKGAVPDFGNLPQLKKWIINNLPLLGPITIKDNDRTFNFSKSQLERSLKGVDRKSKEVKRNSYFSLRELIENSIYGGWRETDERHPKTKGQELYYNAFEYDGKTYGIEIYVDIPLENISPYVYSGHNIAEINQNKETSRKAGLVPGKGTAPLQSEVSEYSISDIAKTFNQNISGGQTFYQSAKNTLPETIDINGEQKPTTNSEGRPIAATEEGVRNFYKWFGDSKTVDENGRPLEFSDDENLYIIDGNSNTGIARYTWKLSHRAPSASDEDINERIENSGDVSLLEAVQGHHNQPPDYFEPMGARYYGYDDKTGMESAAAVRKAAEAVAAGKKNVKITVYRAVPEDVLTPKLENGDWITLSRTYAKDHGEIQFGKYKIIKQSVPISEIWWDGNDIREWGYDNGQGKKKNLYVSVKKPKYQDSLPDNWKQARELQQAGYDGVITPQGELLAFNRTQIKSIYNSGSFSNTNPNIFYQSSKEPDRFRREDYAWAFRKDGDTKNAIGNAYAIAKINSVIKSLINELQKRKIDPETKERITRTLRSAIGYKGYLARVRQARSIIDEAQRRMSDQKPPFKEQQTLTPEKRAEIIKVRTDPEKQKEIDRKAGKSEHENWDRAKEYARDLGRSVSDRAAGISPKLKLAFREFTRKFNLERTAHSKALEPFIKAYREMSEDDRAVFDWAAFNGDTKTIEEYKQKYKDLAPALETYRQVLDDIYNKAAEAGFDVGYIQDYFPRKVKDYAAFKTFLKGTKEWTFIEEYLKKELNIKDPDKWMTDGQHDDVIADIINRYMRGTGIEGRGNGKPGNIKKRRIIEVTGEMMAKYYYALDESILMYAASMDKAIQARKLFGYDLLHEEDTVGMIVKDIVEERKAAHAKNPEIPELTTDDEAELMKDINAFLHPQGPGELAQTIKDWGYMLTLVSPISTITQLEDLSVAIVENGAGRTVSAAFETARKKGKKIALEDIGVEQYDIDINSGRMSQKILGTALKATGFSAFDRFGKETFILSDFNKRAEQVKKNKADFIAECEMYGYEPERIKNMVECFLKGDINDINDDAKSLLFYDLAEVQPIDLAEMPVYYLRGGTLRIAYALKTFTLKRLNYLITKTQRLAKKGQILWDNGDKAGAMAEWAKGVGIMTWTLFLLVAAGASMDWLKDLILRRQSDVPSLLVDNLLKQASFNRWEIKRAVQEGIFPMLIAKVLPPVAVTVQDAVIDYFRVIDGKLTLKDIKFWNHFPVVGRFYYWWLGGGTLITEKQKEKEARKKRAKKRRQKQRRRE